MDEEHPKICFVSASAAMYEILAQERPSKTGGAELQQKLIGSELTERGASVRYVVPAGADGRKAAVIGGMQILPSIRPAQGMKFVRALYPMLSVFRGLKLADADVYYHRGSGPVAGYMGLYCRLNRKPYIFGCANNTDVDGSVERSYSAPDRALYRQCIANASYVICQTERQQELLREHHSRDGVLVKNIYPMADAPKDQRERDIVLWVGRFCSAKRPEMFVSLASAVPDRKFVMVGGPFELEPSIYQAIQEKAKQIPNLTLTGPLPYDEAARYYGRAMFLVCTSRVEGFPNTFLGAWTAGAPVVSTFDPDGIVARHHLGYPCVSLAELVSHTRALADNADERVALGSHVLEYARENHSPERIADRLSELFLDAARGHRSER